MANSLTVYSSLLFLLLYLASRIRSLAFWKQHLV